MMPTLSSLVTLQVVITTTCIASSDNISSGNGLLPDGTKPLPEPVYKVGGIMTPRPHLNIKMLSYQYSDPHVKDKMVSRPSYL